MSKHEQNTGDEYRVDMEQLRRQENARPLHFEIPTPGPVHHIGDIGVPILIDPDMHDRIIAVGRLHGRDDVLHCLEGVFGWLVPEIVKTVQETIEVWLTHQEREQAFNIETEPLFEEGDGGE